MSPVSFAPSFRERYSGFRTGNGTGKGKRGKMRCAGGTDGKFGVAMTGRSVMGHWFKFWNFPEMLSRYAIYFSWPIPYQVHPKGPYRLQYGRVVPPRPRQ